MLPITIESGTRVEWRAPGPQGIQGAPGPQGIQGETGHETPTGGTTGKALVKASDADYDFGWAAPVPAPHAASHAIGGSDPLTPAAIGAVPTSTATTKGDMMVRGSSALERLAVGTIGTNPLLIPDTSASGGLKWGTWAEAGVARAGITTSAINVTWSPATPVLTLTATATVTLPAASANTAQLATIMNIGSGTVTINRSGSDLIAGSLTTTSIPGQGTLRLISDGTGWRVLDGSYDTDTVGLASYEWRHSGTPGWRLIAYDSGWRGVTADLEPAAATKFPNGILGVRRQTGTVTVRFYAGTGTVTGAGVTVIYSLPVGFRVHTLSTRGPAGSTLNAMAGIPTPHLVYSDGPAVIGGFTSASPDYTVGHLTADASDALPTSLPGTQVTAPA